MLSVKVLGPGCWKCEKLEDLVLHAVDQIKAKRPDLEVTVEKISDPMQFPHYGLLATPGLVINEKLISAGRIPVQSQIVDWLREALDNYK